jgi:hypothetical protein
VGLGILSDGEKTTRTWKELHGRVGSLARRTGNSLHQDSFSKSGARTIWSHRFSLDSRRSTYPKYLLYLSVVIYRSIHGIRS